MNISFCVQYHNPTHSAISGYQLAHGALPGLGSIDPDNLIQRIEKFGSDVQAKVKDGELEVTAPKGVDRDGLCGFIQTSFFDCLDATNITPECRSQIVLSEV